MTSVETSADERSAFVRQLAGVAPLQAAEAPAPQVPPPPAAGNPTTDKGEKSDVRKLIDYFGTVYRLVHHAGKAYAVPRRPEALVLGGEQGVALPLGGEMRRKILRASSTFGSVKLMGRSAADTVMDHLEAQAFDGPETPLSLRFDQAVGRVCIDLAQHQTGGLVPARARSALLVDAGGWRVDAFPDDAVFRRAHTTKPLPIPAPDGRLDMLAELLALHPADPVFAAMIGWLITVVFAGAVRPGLLLTGPPGTGKSTRLRLLASVLEPVGVDGLGSSFGHNFADDQVRALSRAIPLWDNLTTVSGQASDQLCCIITGTSREGRTLFTNNEISTVTVQRPVGLTAVGVPAGFRPDALDRLVVLEVPRVEQRIDDAELQRRFDQLHPMLLGAVADAVSAVLRWRPRIVPPTVHRMAAHAHILAALDAAVAAGELVGCPAGLLATYVENHRQVQERTAADDVFGAALLELLAVRGGRWRGKASELLKDAALHGGSAWGDRSGPGWPSSPRKVPEVLAHLQEGLGALGVRWIRTTVNGSAVFTFEKQPSVEGSL